MLTEILFASASAALLVSVEFTPRILFGGSLIVLAALLPWRQRLLPRIDRGAGCASADRRIASQWPLHFGHPFQALQHDNPSATTPPARSTAPDCPEPVQRPGTGRQRTASACGFTHQFGLEATTQKATSQGLAVLGFPQQPVRLPRPGTDGEIAGFCRKTTA
jgi:hypothetical protein